MNNFIYVLDSNEVKSIEQSKELNIQKQYSKEELLQFYANQLNFPDYFGYNWDAFVDCMRDLSWVETKQITILHEVLPLENDIDNLTIYLQILNYTKEFWKNHSNIHF